MEIIEWNLLKQKAYLAKYFYLDVRDNADRSGQRLLCLLPCQGHLSILVAAPQFPHKPLVVGDLLFQSLRCSSLLLALALLLKLLDQLVHFHLTALLFITFKN